MATADASALEVRRSRGSRIALALGVGAALLGLVAWFVTHPPAQATSGSALRASVPAGGSVYLGVYTPGTGSARTLHLTRVAVEHAGNATVRALVCLDGALGVTTAPDSFCRRLEPAAGTALGPGDQLVLEVTSGDEGTVRVSRPRLTYRDGVQWGTAEAGHRASVTFLAR